MASVKVRVKRGGSESLTRQITDQLGRMIQTGVLAAGELLPSERTLAEAAGVARNVVRRSYELLTASGHIESASRRGRRVRRQSAKKSGGAKKSSGKSGAKKSARKGSAKKRR